MNTLTATERVISIQDRKIIYHAFENYFYALRENKQREKKLIKLQLADFKTGESVYDEKGSFIGYCPESFDREAGINDWMKYD